MISERLAMAKVRGRIRRQMATAEDEEFEGGELNLVPYMDIVVNTVIFLLATMTSGLTLANINVNSPRYEPSGPSAQSEPQDPEKQRLNLTIAISYKGYLVAGASGVVTHKQSGSNISVPCKQIENGRCAWFTGKAWRDEYDYEKLIEMMKEAKSKFPHERQVIMTADRHVPYKVVVQTMDTVRGKATTNCTGEDGCLFDQVILSAGVQ